MKIKMLVDAPGSPDGVTVNGYAAGEEYDVSAALAAAFVAERFAEKAGKPKPAQNKRGTGPRENKRGKR